MHDYQKAAQAWLECNFDLQADSMIAPVFAAIPARAYETPRREDTQLAGTRRAARSQLPVQRERVDAGGRVRPADRRSHRLSAPLLSAPRCGRHGRLLQAGLPARHGGDRGRAALDDALGRPRRAGKPGQAGGRGTGVRRLGRGHLSSARPVGGRRLPGPLCAHVAGSLRFSRRHAPRHPGHLDGHVPPARRACSKPATGWRL